MRIRDILYNQFIEWGGLKKLEEEGEEGIDKLSYILRKNAPVNARGGVSRTYSKAVRDFCQELYKMYNYIKKSHDQKK